MDRGGSGSGQEADLPQAFLFLFYGLILQAEENGDTVRTHLRTLLETSHQWPKQREVRARASARPDTDRPRPHA